MCSTPTTRRWAAKLPSIAMTRLAVFLARSPTRSRSLAMWIAAMISRRSCAIGWRRAIMQDGAVLDLRAAACRSARSLAMTRWARLDVARGRERRPKSATCCSARPPISAILLGEIVEFVVEGADDVFGHRGSCLVACARSAEAAGDVVLRAPVARRGEDLRSVSSNSTSSPRYMKAVKSETRAACCMLWVTMTIV